MDWSNPILFHGDLNEEAFRTFENAQSLAVDTETLGLIERRDRLCLVQLSDEVGRIALVKINPAMEPVLLKTLLEDSRILKIFHFARFDMRFIWEHLGSMPGPVYCTKIASKIARTASGGHGLKDLTKALLGFELPKEEGTSDWGGDLYSPAQLEYAANDVRYLHQLKDRLESLLTREDREHLAHRSFDYLPTLVELDHFGWENVLEH